MRKSFVIHIDSLDVLDVLTDEQAGKLFKAIKSYQKNEKYNLDQLLNIAFLPFINQFIRDEEKYNNTCERNKNNGSKGGRPKNPDKPKETQNNPLGFLETQNNPEKPKKPDSDNNSNSDNKNESKKNNNIDLSLFNEKEIEVVKNWLDYRKEIKKPLTLRGLNLIKQDFQKYGVPAVEFAMSKSIKNNYQGYFIDEKKVTDVYRNRDEKGNIDENHVKMPKIITLEPTAEDLELLKKFNGK